MNARFILIHALVLIGIGTGVGMQRRSIAEMERRTEALHNSVVEHPASARRPAGATGGNPGFSKLLHAANRSSNGIGERALLRLGVLIPDLSAREIANSLDELATLELQGDRHSTLETLLIDRLIREAPQLALERFKHHIEEGNGNMIRKLSRAFGAWAGEDMSSATAWFDREIAVGTFDSMSLGAAGESRLSFEATLMPVLLDTDPAAAGRRVQALPAETHLGLFLKAIGSDPKPGPLADLVSATCSQGSDMILSVLIRASAERGRMEEAFPLIERIVDHDVRKQLRESLAR